MTLISFKQTPLFRKTVKKLHKQDKLILDREIKVLIKNPKMGELNEMQKESVDEIYQHSTSLLSTVESFLKLQLITENKLKLKKSDCQCCIIKFQN